MSNNTFIFNLEWYNVLMEYPAEVRFEVYEAIMRYASSGKLPELKPLAKMAFSFIKKEMDYNRDRYEESIEKRRKAGAKGGKAKQSQANQANEANATDAKQSQANEANATDAKQSQANEANATDAKQSQANQAHNVNDNVNDNDIYFLERVNAGVEEIRSAYLNIFFSPEKQISLDKLLKKWETSKEELTKVCEDVLDDWTHEEMVHSSVEDAKRYFYNAVRFKYSKIKSSQNDKSEKISSKGVRSSGKRNSGQSRNALDTSPKPGFGLVD